MRIALLSTLVAVGVSVAASRVDAHHAFAAEFDVSKPVALKGTVKKVELINPHSWIHIEVADEGGQAVVWMVEGGSPNALIRRGITRASLPVGAELKVDGYQARDGSHRAVARSIAFSDGRTLFFSTTDVPAGSAQ